MYFNTLVNAVDTYAATAAEVGKLVDVVLDILESTALYAAAAIVVSNSQVFAAVFFKYPEVPVRASMAFKSSALFTLVKSIVVGKVALVTVIFLPDLVMLVT